MLIVSTSINAKNLTKELDIVLETELMNSF